MSTDTRFEVEIASAVAAWAAAGKELTPAFITHEIVTQHEARGLARECDDTTFFKHYTYKALRKDVGTYIAKAYGDDQNDKRSKDTFLPGFEFVQQYYVIRRGADDIAVPVGQMSDEEIDAKIMFIERRGRACLAHADELRRYKKLRKTKAVA